MTPVSLEEVKEHLRFTYDSEDSLILSRIKMITAFCEDQTQLSLMGKTLELIEPSFNCKIVLPRPPVQSIVSIKYLDVNGVEQTLAESEYVVNNFDEQRAFVMPSYGKSWPDVLPGIDSVKIRYIAGYPSPSIVPEPLKLWILLQIGHWFENRSAVNSGDSISKMEYVDALLEAYKIWSF